MLPWLTRPTGRPSRRIRNIILVYAPPAPSLRKFLPHLSLASVTADLTVSLAFHVTINSPSLLHPYCVLFPTDRVAMPSAAGTRVLLPKQGDAPARTSSLEPSCRAYTPKSCAVRVCTPRRRPSAPASTSSAARSTSSSASTVADLRLPSLIAPSIASNLSHHADDPDSSLSDLDLVLCDRLPASIALHARHLRALSPTRTSMGIVPSTCMPSVPLPGSEG
jgi:hypothetical protein